MITGQCIAKTSSTGCASLFSRGIFSLGASIHFSETRRRNVWWQNRCRPFVAAPRYSIAMKTIAPSLVGALASLALGGEANDPCTPPNFPLPEFRSAVFNVRDFGATGNGNTNDTSAINRAIDACSVSGGGDIVFPGGTYSAASIHLKSNVRFVLENNAVITDASDRARAFEAMHSRKLPHPFNGSAPLTSGIQSSPANSRMRAPMIDGMEPRSTTKRTAGSRVETRPLNFTTREAAKTSS